MFILITHLIIIILVDSNFVNKNKKKNYFSVENFQYKIGSTVQIIIIYYLMVCVSLSTIQYKLIII